MKWLIAGVCLVAVTAQAQETPIEDRNTRGDVLLIEKVERSRGVVAVPRQGMRKAQVTAEFGEPASRTGPVGEPPITRWRYESFTVYFEDDTVLHAVVHRDTLGLGRPS